MKAMVLKLKELESLLETTTTTAIYEENVNGYHKNVLKIGLKLNGSYEESFQLFDNKLEFLEKNAEIGETVPVKTLQILQNSENVCFFVNGYLFRYYGKKA